MVDDGGEAREEPVGQVVADRDDLAAVSLPDPPVHWLAARAGIRLIR
jgi:hypothetical protein